MIRSITYANLNNWNYLDYAGTASIDIIRIGSDITVSWDGSVIVSGVTGDPISKVVIAFMYYPFYGDSFFGTESIDLVKIEGTPIPITVNPYRNEYVIMVGTEYDQSSGKLLYIPINKDGTFGSVSEVADIGYRAGAGIADFDNDGDLDFVAGAREDSLPVANFYLFENIGNGNFVKRLIASNIPCPERVATFAVADFNEDGFKDFVAPINLSEDIYLFTNNGDNTYAWSKLTPLSTGEAKEGDFNGDGHMDFVITDYFNAEVYLYQGDGNGGFTKKFLFDVAGNYQAEEITSGDFNGDGHLDIIVDDFVPHGGGAYLYTGNIENGTLEFVYQGPVFSRPLLVGSTYYGNVYGVDSYDFDKDGHRDLILSTYEYPPVGLVFVMRGKGNGTFWPPEPIPTPPFDTLGSVFPVTPSQVPRDMSLTVVSLVGDLVSNSSTGPFVPATTAYLAGRQLPRDDGGLDKYVRIKDAYWIWMDNFIGDMTNPLYFTKTFQIPGSAIDIIGTMEVSTDNYS